MSRKFTVDFQIRRDKNGNEVIVQTSEALEGVEVQAKKAGAAVDRMSGKQRNLGVSSRQVNNTLMNTGRVVQDLPYGFIGIANNIDPLVESFQRLKTQSGSATTALKTLAGGLIGPAGLGIAISAVTSIIIAYGDDIKEFFTDPTKEADEALKSYYDRVIDLNKELSKVKDLSPVEATRSNLILLNNRLNPLKEQEAEQARLQERFGLEGMDAAEVQGFRGTLRDNNPIIPDLERYIELLQTQENREEKISTLQDLKKETLEQLATEQGLMTDEQAKQIKNEKELIELEKRREENAKKMAQWRRENGAADVNLTNPFPDQDVNLLGDMSMEQQLGVPDEVINSLQRLGYSLGDIIGLYSEFGNKAIFAAEQSNMLSMALEQGVEQSLVSFGKTLGNIMAGNGGMEELGNVMLNGLAGIMETFGTSLIMLGIGAEKLKTLFTNPIAAVAAGTALIAAAQIVKQSTQSSINSLGGGSGGNAVVGYRGVSGGGDAGIMPGSNGPVNIQLTNGFGDIVAQGTMENDRRPSGAYAGRE